MNIQRNQPLAVTEALPNSFPDGNRMRSPNYPFEFIDPPKPLVPQKADPTYTFWRKSNDTFPMGSIVYFMYAAGRIKIGYSDGLVSRHTALRAGSPFPPIVLLIVSGTLSTEKEFHKRFAAERRHGEWFDLSQKMRNFFTRRLCPVGRQSLRSAEYEFARYCRETLA